MPALKTKPSDIRLVTLIGILTFILALLLLVSKYRKKEEQFTDFLSIDQLVNTQKTSTYLQNGFKYFFASGSPNTISTSTGAEFKNMMSFAHTQLDSMCLSTSRTESLSNACRTAYIDDISCYDQTYIPITKAEQSCMSVSSMLGPTNNNNCDVRILHNNYTFMKRCFKLPEISSISVSGSNGFAESTIGFSNAQSTNLIPFVLARPLFISFGPLGLYSIDHQHPNCILRSFPTVTLQLVLRPIVTGLNDLQISPFTNGQLQNTVEFKKRLQNLPATIYYLKYREPIAHSLTTTPIEYSNTLTMLLSDDLIHVIRTVPIPTKNGTSSNFIHAIELMYSPSSVSYRFAIKINSQGALYQPHPEFDKEIRAFETTSTGHSYHMLITISFDLLIISSFLRYDTASGIVSKCFIQRHKITTNGPDGTSPLYLNYLINKQGDNGSIVPILRRVPNVSKNIYDEIEQFKSLYNMTCIPDISNIAKALAYNFI